MFLAGDAGAFRTSVLLCAPLCSSGFSTTTVHLPNTPDGASRALITISLVFFFLHRMHQVKLHVCGGWGLCVILFSSYIIVEVVESRWCLKQLLLPAGSASGCKELRPPPTHPDLSQSPSLQFHSMENILSLSHRQQLLVTSDGHNQL